MKQFLWILWLCPVVAAVSCPTVQAKDEATVIHIEQMWARALEQHDTATLACVLADEFEDADTDGRVTDRRATLEKAATARAVHHELSDLHAHVHGDFAYIRGLAEAIDSQAKIIARVRFTDIYIYREGRWQCVAGQESLVHANSN